MVTSFGKGVEEQTEASASQSDDLYFLVRPNDDGTYDAYRITDQILKAKRMVEKTADYTATAEDEIILVDATSAAVTITFPTAAGIQGVSYTVKKTDAGGNTVTLNPAGSETIEGSATKVLSTQWSYYTITSDGENWIITGS